MKETKTYIKRYFRFDEDSNNMIYDYKSLELTDTSFVYILLNSIVILSILIPLIVAIILSIYINAVCFIIVLTILITSSAAIIGTDKLTDTYFYSREHIKKQVEEFNNQIDELTNQERKRCDEWRSNHPFEEKVRLAMENNPNYVADLIRYIKFNLKEGE